MKIFKNATYKNSRKKFYEKFTEPPNIFETDGAADRMVQSYINIRGHILETS